MGNCWHMRESDSLIRNALACARKAGFGTVGRAERSKAVAKRRGEALRAFFPKLSIRRNHPIDFARMRGIEHYLREAADLAELERRIALIERDAGRH
ncbi:MAG TPA: hypothetical protein VMG60_02515 [Burkholderiaceae bacterium]|nr:hypothetical protein [Burkholderiaceae bacterium]